MSGKNDSWEKRVERVLKASLEVQRKILDAILAHETEQIEIVPGKPKFRAKAALHSNQCFHGHKNHHH